MTYDLTSVYSLLSSIFRIPSAWFGFPALITNIIIPLILMSYAFYSLLGKIRIFGYHTGINIIIAFILAFIMIPAGPLIAIIAAAFVGMFAMRTWKSRIIFVGILFFIYFIAIPWLSAIRF